METSDWITDVILGLIFLALSIYLAKIIPCARMLVEAIFHLIKKVNKTREKEVFGRVEKVFSQKNYPGLIAEMI